MAYAAVISLKRNIERLTNPTINPQITKSAHDKLNYLQKILEELDARKRKQSFDTDAIIAVDADMRKAVWRVEDAVESYAFYHSLPPNSDSDNGFPQLTDHEGVEQEIDSFIQTAETLGSMFETQLNNPLVVVEEEDEAVASPTPDFVSANKSATAMIGLSDEFKSIRNQLVGEGGGDFEIVSLVGMAGIGKSHLAREIYRDPVVVDSFGFRTWVRVGQKPAGRGRVKSILVDIVAQLKGKPRNQYLDKHVYTLSQLLKESWPAAAGGGYLIVLDDIWSGEICHDLMLWLPANVNRRFLLTTRLQELDVYNNTIHLVPFLDNEKSWDLFWQNVFAGTSSCPPQLEKVGRKIAEACEGLPLLIITVADILCGLDTTEEYWNKVANNKTSTFTDAYERIEKVLLSSYEYLPEYLKACFLYMGVFPQTSVIPLSKLINLWAVDEIFEPTRPSVTLEDFSVECLNSLVSNSLVIVCKRSYKHIIKSFKLHSAYWYVGVKEARSNKFFLVLNRRKDDFEDFIESQRRLSVQNSILFGIKQVHDSVAATAATARSLLCTGEDHEYPVPICMNLMLLKVLDALPIRLYKFPEDAVKLLLLRYLALTHNGGVPSSISKLQQLQFLIVRRHHNIKFLRDLRRSEKRWEWDIQGCWSIELVKGLTCLPMEIWDMQKLRHLCIKGSNLPDPSSGSELPNLVTLYVSAHSCTEAVFRGTPHLKKLIIEIELLPNAVEILSCFEHVMLLEELESLKCVVVNPRLRSNVFAPPHHLSNLPMRLKKLSLNGLGYSWEYMNVIGSLPNLQVLRLRCWAFQGPRWETKVGEFSRLEYLLLEDLDLVEWAVTTTITDIDATYTAVDAFPIFLQRICCFPRRDERSTNHNASNCLPSLERLVIRHCFKLKVIPRQIGEIPTLTRMDVQDCSPCVEDSAKKILRSSVWLVVDSSWDRR